MDLTTYPHAVILPLQPSAHAAEHCYATFLLDPHGVMLEVLCHAPAETDGEG